MLLLTWQDPFVKDETVMTTLAIIVGTAVVESAWRQATARLSVIQ